MNYSVLSNPYFIGVMSGLGGVLCGVITQRILNRRGLLTYFVTHTRVGVSTDDPVFGSVRLTWNENPVANLYSSNIELINESSMDYENVHVKAWSKDTILLTERTEIANTTHSLRWTDEFATTVHVPEGEKATPGQIEIYSRERNYVIPVLNRGAIVRLFFLNAARTEASPTIWLDVIHKGMRLKFRVKRPEIFGVAQPTAATVGVALGFIFIITLVIFVQTAWIAALLALVFGLAAVVPGAFAVKASRWLRNIFSG